MTSLYPTTFIFTLSSPFPETTTVATTAMNPARHSNVLATMTTTTTTMTTTRTMMTTVVSQIPLRISTIAVKVLVLEMGMAVAGAAQPGNRKTRAITAVNTAFRAERAGMQTTLPRPAEQRPLEQRPRGQPKHTRPPLERLQLEPRQREQQKLQLPRAWTPAPS